MRLLTSSTTGWGAAATPPLYNSAFSRGDRRGGGWIKQLLFRGAWFSWIWAKLCSRLFSWRWATFICGAQPPGCTAALSGPLKQRWTGLIIAAKHLEDTQKKHNTTNKQTKRIISANAVMMIFSLKNTKRSTSLAYISWYYCLSTTFISFQSPSGIFNNIINWFFSY